MRERIEITETLCDICSAVVPTEEAETCGSCGAVVCDECWLEHDHLDDEEVDW